MKKISILVSHPTRQHVHQLCYALQKKGYLHKFITSIWFKPDSFPFTVLPWLPKKIKNNILNFLSKRHYKPLNLSFISLFPYSQLFYRIFNSILPKEETRWILYGDRIHDWYVAKQIAKEGVNIVIGYENASLSTFMKAKQQGKITILDLAQVHHQFIGELRERYSTFKETLSSDSLFLKANIRKDKHYLYTDYVFALSSFARKTLIDAGFPENRIYTLNLGFDPGNFALKSEYTATHQLKLLFAGTITKRKGIQLVLEALSQLNLPNIHLTLVGPIADGHDILERYRGLYTHVPFLQHNELVKYYQNADVFVFPSYLDSWAMVVLEAMACGTPVIISENTGAKDAVEKGGGFIIPVDDVTALKEKILFFYHNRDLIKELGMQAHQTALTYTWSNYYQQVEQAIEDIMEREQSRIQPHKQLL